MSDRENVIERIHEAIDMGICVDLFMDVLAMLKKQEAKIPSITRDVNGIWSTCPTCGNKLRAILAMDINTYFPKHCQECGQAVKWERLTGRKY